MCEQEVDSDSGICSWAVGARLAFPKSIGFISCTHQARDPQKAESSWVGCKYWNVTGQNPFTYCTRVDRSDLLQPVVAQDTTFRRRPIGTKGLQSNNWRLNKAGQRKVWYSEHEKCYPVLIETVAVAVSTAQLTVTSCFSSSSGVFNGS